MEVVTVTTDETEPNYSASDTSNSSNDSDFTHVASTLSAGEAALHAIRCRVGIVNFSMGITSGLAYQVLVYTSNPDVQFLNAILPVLFMFRVVHLCIAPLLDDVKTTRAAIALEFFFILVELFWFASELHADIYFRRNCAIIDAIALGSLAAAFVQCSSARMHWWMFLSIRVYLALLSINFVYCFGITGSSIWSISWTTVAFLFVTVPICRRRFRGCIEDLLDKYQARAAAAGIAGLVGGCSVTNALKEAKQRFRCISLDRVHFGDLSESQRGTENDLFSRTEKCPFHRCDAFISHSWHDAPNAKWLALQTWRASFVSTHGREPRVWFDKACIDQKDIEADLRVLPLFLGGSTDMVILFGPTYLSRLWCIVELFTFIHMGGSLDHIIVLDIGSKVNFKEGIETFTASACKCFLEVDKQRMLNIIEIAFGDLHRFDLCVRALLRARLEDV